MKPQKTFLCQKHALVLFCDHAWENLFSKWLQMVISVILFHDQLVSVKGFILKWHAQLSSRMKTFHLKHQLSVVVHSVYVGYKSWSQASHQPWVNIVPKDHTGLIFILNSEKAKWQKNQINLSGIKHILIITFFRIIWISHNLYTTLVICWLLLWVRC